MPWMIALTLLLMASGALAQTTPSIDLGVDVGPSVPLGEFADDGAGLGLGFSVSATVRPIRLLGVYAAYERTSFPVDEAARPDDDDRWTDNGFSVGVRFWVPVRESSRLHPWGRLGVGWHDLDQPLGGPEFSLVDTEGVRTIGGAAGVDLVLANQAILLRPTVRYRRYSFTVESPTETSTSRVAFLTFGLGAAVVVGFP